VGWLGQEVKGVDQTQWMQHSKHPGQQKLQGLEPKFKAAKLFNSRIFYLINLPLGQYLQLQVVLSVLVQRACCPKKMVLL